MSLPTTINKFDLTQDDIISLSLKGITRQAFANRITQCGWSKQQALSQKPCKREILSDKDKALLKSNQIHISTYSKRRKRGWSKHKAMTTRPRQYQTLKENL